MIRYGALLVLFVLAYMLMLRPIQKQALSAGKQLPVMVPQPALPEEIPAPVVPDDAARTNMLKQQLTQLVKTEPASTARAVQAWVRGETQ